MEHTKTRQKTINRPTFCTGVGLHSGLPITMVLRPAPPNHGVVFSRLDKPGSPAIRATVDNVADARLATTLGGDGIRVGVVEHLMAALAGCGVDNVLVELNGPEVPIMDGSSAPHMMLIKGAGLAIQDAPRTVIKVKKPIRVEDGDRMVEIRPAEGMSVDFTIEFDHPLLAKQKICTAVDAEIFDEEIARARTFGFAKDAMALQKLGLARGGSLDNTVIIDEFRVMNPSGLRFDDEFVRHKVLDLIGDLSLLGKPLRGHIVAHKSGHALNHAVVEKLLATPQSWEAVTPGLEQISQTRRPEQETISLPDLVSPAPA